MARTKKSEDEGLRFILLVIGVFTFIPFMFLSFIHYKKLKKQYFETSNSQRIFDVGQLIKSVFHIAGLIVPVLIVIFYIAAFTHPKHHESILWLTPLVILLFVYPLLKLAQRVAVRYLGVIFNDDTNMMIIPIDLVNASVSEHLRLQFLRRMGDCESIPISIITSFTRETGVNFYIHGDFGSRKINFTTKQKRDECLMALQARTSIRGGRDLGY